MRQVFLWSSRIFSSRLRTFSTTTRHLVESKNEDSKPYQLIDPRFARRFIEKESKKTFQDKKMAYENLHEIFWTILYQHLNMREEIIAACKEDKQYASYWENISTSDRTYSDVPRDIPLVTGDPLDTSMVSGGPFLTFSKEMRELIFIDNANLMSEISSEIERRADRSDGLRLALDAEWSAYETKPPASILQISLNDMAFVLDVDHLPGDVINPFVDMLFGHPKILKLGFQFNMDLKKLRMAKSL
ncbi:hypothetical protein PMAYCL1PPCAC_27962, partial [Pristionchus mayeri]